MTEAELDAIVMRDTLHYIARRRREDLELGLYKNPHPSRDNVAVHDGHKANTYRRFPRTSNDATHPEQKGATHPTMRVRLPDGTWHTTRASRGWRQDLPSPDSESETRTDAEIVGSITEHGHDWEA
jgi:hypothetical protein